MVRQGGDEHPTKAPTARVVRSALLSLPSIWLASFLVGYGFHSIEGVGDPRTLWIGNISWPYVLIPVIASVGQRSLAKAVVRSAGSGVFMVLGFYNVLGLLTVGPIDTGLDPGTSRLSVTAVAVRSYVDYNVLGRPGTVPWITVAALFGATVATCHHAAVRRGHTTVFWSAVGLIGLLEPVLHFAPFLAWLPFGGYAFDGPAKVMTIGEWTFAVLVLLFARRLRDDRVVPGGTA